MIKLKNVLNELNIKQSDVMEIIGIKSLSTINLKLNGKAEFTTKEALNLKNYINRRFNKKYSLEELFSDESEV